MDDPWKHYAEWKKPVPKDHTVDDSIYMKCPEEANPSRQKVDQWLPEAARRGQLDVRGVMQAVRSTTIPLRWDQSACSSAQLQTCRHKAEHVHVISLEMRRASVRKGGRETGAKVFQMLKMYCANLGIWTKQDHSWNYWKNPSPSEFIHYFLLTGFPASPSHTDGSTRLCSPRDKNTHWERDAQNVSGHLRWPRNWLYFSLLWVPGFVSKQDHS